MKYTVKICLIALLFSAYFPSQSNAQAARIIQNISKDLGKIIVKSKTWQTLSDDAARLIKPKITPIPPPPAKWTMPKMQTIDLKPLKKPAVKVAKRAGKEYLKDKEEESNREKTSSPRAIAPPKAGIPAQTIAPAKTGLPLKTKPRYRLPNQ